ncbi:cyclin-T1-3-like [Aristolochia californica]|uniref:cyclin-T1-3-like n=1 Tax=Aristolochia californica TaxID=171875 RepID=UPI0035DEC3EE
MDECDQSGPGWYFSRKEIEENSPSRRDGIDFKKETYFRKSYCTYLKNLGMTLKAPQVMIATAIIFCHRFFLRQSHMKNDRWTIATACLFLAGKVEGTPCPLKDVILVSYEIIHKKDPAAVQRIKQKETSEQQKEVILLAERVVLATLGFDLNVQHPYKPLFKAIKKFEVAQNALIKVAWNIINDGLPTSLCLQFEPHHLAAGAIFLAAKWLMVKLPSDGEKVWWQEFDINKQLLEEVSNQMSEQYEQNGMRPVPSHGSEVEGSAGGASSNSHRTSTKISSVDEPVLVNNQNGSQRNENQNDALGSTERKSDGVNIKSDSVSKEPQHYNDLEPFCSGRGDILDASDQSKNVGSEQPIDDQQRDGKGEILEAGEWKKNEGSLGEASGVGASNSSLYNETTNAIKKIDMEKVKAALAKRKKARVAETAPRKLDPMDDYDLIERELESGIELALESEKSKRSGK